MYVGCSKGRRPEEAATTTRVHIHLHVADLAASQAFYEKLFAVAPVKEKPNYVKFLPEFAPINLALSQASAREHGRGATSHLVVQLDSTSAVVAHLSRVKAAGLSVREEMSVNCCFANQDKFWVQDPDGVEWEVYHLNYDLEERQGGQQERTLAIPLASVGACCAPSEAARGDLALERTA